MILSCNFLKFSYSLGIILPISGIYSIGIISTYFFCIEDINSRLSDNVPIFLIKFNRLDHQNLSNMTKCFKCKQLICALITIFLSNIYFFTQVLSNIHLSHIHSTYKITNHVFVLIIRFC